MNIALISVTASFHHLAKRFENDPKVKNIYHFGANIKLKKTEKYNPIPYNIPYDRNIDDSEIIKLLDIIVSKDIDFVLTSHLSISCNSLIHETLKNNNISYFFVDPNIAHLEIDRIRTKKFLKMLDIPFSPATFLTGKDLYENFFNYQRPFVIKLKTFMHGRQTVIVDDSNVNEVFDDLFSIFVNFKPKITNIGYDSEVVLEKFVKLKYEYSYIALLNKSGWKYFGSAKDYKKEFDNDLGNNTIGMGAINFDDIHPVVHEYMDKIFKGLKSYLEKKNQHYRGFMFLNIGVTEDDIPIVLEINARAGEPEIDVILESIDNSISDLFFLASNDKPIPDIIKNSSKVSCVRVVSKNIDWTRPVLYYPNFILDDNDVNVYLHGTDQLGLYHSLVISSSNSHASASEKIYQFLDRQNLKGFYYRKDIGLV
jgi:phosphoribosylamine--glycine ligase